MDKIVRSVCLASVTVILPLSFFAILGSAVFQDSATKRLTGLLLSAVLLAMWRWTRIIRQTLN